ncbi:hypothetical protein [Brachybacterium huguangmaarense]
MTTHLRAASVAALALTSALALGACAGSDQKTETKPEATSAAAPSSDAATPAAESTGAASSAAAPAQSGPTPALPTTVGDYSSDDPNPTLSLYTSSSNQVVSLFFQEDVAPETLAKALGEPQTIGQWQCLEYSGAPTCMGAAYGGTVTITGGGSLEEVAAFGDQFLAAWV